MKFFEYDYVETDVDERQYDDVDIKNNVGVYARYVKVETDKGNPFIEALPRPRVKEELNLACQKGIPGYSHENEIRKDTLSQILGILRLRDVRFPLPINYVLEEDMYFVLVLSYRKRNLFRDKDIKLEYSIKGKTGYADGTLVGEDNDGTNGGLTILGRSGCGKSSALKTLFDGIPQLILHPGEGLTVYPQIVYLVVQCPPHSNFRGLYRNIGAALDRALGNVRPVYADELDAGERGNLAKFTHKVRTLIEKFAIGCIVLDEIQHISFDTTTENSFESILELSNQTKVAFIVVGTEDAYEKLFSGNERQSRRLGAERHADKYCKDREMFDYLIMRLFKYQWFKEIITPTQEIMDALYDCTKGIIDYLIGLYIFMSIDYVRAKEKPMLDGRYIEKTMRRHYPGMKDLLEGKQNNESETKREKLLKNAEKELFNIVKKEKEAVAANTVKEVLSGPSAEYLLDLKQFVVGRIMEMDDSYTASTIESAINKVLVSKEGKENVTDQIKIMQLTFKKLKAVGKTDKRKQTASSKTRLAPSTVVDFLHKGFDVPDGNE